MIGIIIEVKITLTYFVLRHLYFVFLFVAAASPLVDSAPPSSPPSALSGSPSQSPSPSPSSTPPSLTESPHAPESADVGQPQETDATMTDAPPTETEMNTAEDAPAGVPESAPTPIPTSTTDEVTKAEPESQPLTEKAEAVVQPESAAVAAPADDTPSMKTESTESSA